MGGHTLARHVGKSDAELADRLRRERQISAASSYADRETAEHAVGAALDADSRRLSAWTHRSGRRPNLVLHYSASGPVGRSLLRGDRASISCDRALVVLRWDERSGRFYVLTSYPDCER
ncbi:MAG TPA: RNase A-like domain-containing protein [Vicinamibacterales bacterium]|nr:RNase A-like domain-containing protein [Vicinamibacterales bacterium]